MKINPNDKQQPILSPNTVSPNKNAESQVDFAKVLDDTVQNSSETVKTEGNIVRSLSMGPKNGMSLPPISGITESKTVHGLLDALENYQKLLVDPKATLKTVAPAVERMAMLSKKAQPMVDNIPEGHPIKRVANHAILEMAKEIERFSAGYYLDA